MLQLRVKLTVERADGKEVFNEPYVVEIANQVMLMPTEMAEALTVALEAGAVVRLKASGPARSPLGKLEDE